MAITQERLGFFNARFEQRVNEKGVSIRELAREVGVTYEHIRKLISGYCLPSDSLLEKLCGPLGLSKIEMRERVVKDRFIFRYGDAAWTVCGLDPRAAPFYILVPLLSEQQWKFARTCMRAVAESHKTDTSEEQWRARPDSNGRPSA